MQVASFRTIVLVAVLVAGVGLSIVLGDPQGSGTPRWPDTTDLYASDPWLVGSQNVDHHSDSGNHTDLVTRVFRNPAGTTATLTIVTNQAPKLYGAGAEVPFLGNGYTVEPTPADMGGLVQNGESALIARRGTERWLVMYAYGERRGLLGNSLWPWTLALTDGILGRPNDYYKLYLIAQVDQLDSRASRDVADLAGTLFPRIAAWYAA